MHCIGSYELRRIVLLMWAMLTHHGCIFTMNNSRKGYWFIYRMQNTLHSQTECESRSYTAIPRVLKVVSPMQSKQVYYGSACLSRT